jgi:hypothetical protein
MSEPWVSIFGGTVEGVMAVMAAMAAVGDGLNVKGKRERERLKIERVVIDV